MNCPRLLIAGVGNIFLGDDAFGVEVVRELARHALPAEVRVADFGIRALDLAYALLDEHEAVILVDALPRGGPPGTLYVVEPTVEPAADGAVCVAGHALDPAAVLRLAAALGGRQDRRVLVVGCEPATTPDDEPMELSPAVRAAVRPAVSLLETLAGRLLRGEAVTPDYVCLSTEDSSCRSLPKP